MDETEIYKSDFKNIIAFLVKMETGSLMDHSPQSIIGEINLVDNFPGTYTTLLNDEQKRRFDAYIEFYKLDIPVKTIPVTGE